MSNFYSFSCKQFLAHSSLQKLKDSGLLLGLFLLFHNLIFAQNCPNISTGNCADVVVSTPVDIQFTGTEGGLLDKDGVKTTGFRMVKHYTGTRNLTDPAIEDTSVPAYVPSRLTVTNDGNLDILATQGTSFTGSTGTNNLLNALGVGFVEQNTEFNIETALIDFTTSGASEAGIWYGINEQNYIKFVVAGTTIQLRREVNGVSATTTTDRLQITGVSGINPAGTTGDRMRLRMQVINLGSTKIVRAYYQRPGDASEIQLIESGVTELVIPSTFQEGITLNDGTNNIENVSFAGIKARYGTTIYTAKFDYFKITPVEKTLVFTPNSNTTSIPLDGGTTSISSTVGSTGAVPSTITLAQSAGSPWLTIPATADLGVPINMDIDVTGLTVGNYIATVTASSAGFANGKFVITLRVTAKDMAFASSQLVFPDIVQGGTTAPLSVALDTDDVSGTAVTLRVNSGGSWVALPSNPTADVSLSFGINTAGLAAGDYQTLVTASAPGYTDAILTVKVKIIAPALPNINWTQRFNFESTVGNPGLPALTPAYVREEGNAYNDVDGYGWINASTGIPQTNTVGAFNRGHSSCTPFTQDYRTLNQLQYPGNESNWEVALPNGIYYVKVASGECTATASELLGHHVINVEGINLIDYQQNSVSGFQENIKQVIVKDGKLTIDAVGGFRSKISYIWIGQVDAADDNIAPTVNLLFEGTQIKPGEFANEVKLTIQAADEGGSGLQSVEFSINGGPYQPYTNALLINEVGAYAISVRVRDGRTPTANETVTPFELFKVVNPIKSNARLFVENVYKFPDNNNYSFSFVQKDKASNILEGPNYEFPNDNKTPFDNYNHDSNEIRLYNQGINPLIITNLILSDNVNFKITRIGGATVTQPSDVLPLIIPQNSFIDVTVILATRNQNLTLAQRILLFEETLTILSNDDTNPTKVLNLHGLYQEKQEGDNEPRIGEVVRALGMKTNTGYDLNNKNFAFPIGDEIFSPYFIRADITRPVYVRQVSAYHTVGNSERIRYWFKTDTSPRSIGLLHDNKDAQTILPRRQPNKTIGERTFPSTTALGTNNPFSIRINEDDTDRNRNNYKVPDVNGDLPIGVRIWRAKNYLNQIIPNAYFMSHDYLSASSNYDYNDNMYFISNIRPEIGTAFFSELVGGNGIVGDANEKQSSLDFGSVLIGDNQVITLNLRSLGQNYANGSSDPNISISGIEIEGANFEEFSATNPVSLTLGPGQQTTMTVTFTPQTVGIKNAVLLVYYNNAISPLRIPLFAIGSSLCYNLNLYKRIKAAATSSNPVVINGRTWESDVPYRKGLFRLDNTTDLTSEILETDDDALYRSYLSSRTNGAPISFQIRESISPAVPMPSGNYLVRLHFAENAFTESGRRVNDIYMENQLVSLAYDIYATNGYKRATTADFEVAVIDGELKIDFLPSVNRPAISAIEIFSITNLSNLGISADIDPTTCGNAVGEIRASALNPNGSVQFKLGKFGIYQTSGTFSNLAAGQYTIFVKEDIVGGCETSQVFTVAQGNNNITFDFDKTPVSCDGVSDGTASITNLTGGTAPYFIIWNSFPIQTGSIATGLTVGDVSVTITDANGCTLTETTRIDFCTEGGNTAPILVSAIGNVVTYKNSPETVINLASKFIDNDGEPLTLSVTNNTNSALVQTSFIGQNIILEYTPDATGVAFITVRATDPNNLFVEGTFRVTVNEINVVVTQIDRKVIRGRKNEPILRIRVDNPSNINATSFTFNTSGTTRTEDITQARLYNTGSSPIFVNPNPVGEAQIAPDGEFTFGDIDETLLAGANYFWLAYDVADNAVVGDVLDAQLISTELRGTNVVPLNGSPSGSREIAVPDLIPGKMLQFDGVSNRLETPLDVEGLFDFVTNITVEGWFKINNLSQNNQTIVSKGSAWYVQTSGDNLRFFLDLGIDVTLTGTRNVRDGEWHHFAAVYNGNNVSLYVDGLLDASTTGSGPIFNVDESLWIGGNEALSNRFFSGFIDEVRVWEVARTREQIRENMHLTLRGNETGLVSYWQMNQGTGLLTLDLANGSDGTLAGGMSETSWFDATNPIGDGEVFRTNSIANSTVDFGSTNLKITFGTNHPNNELTVTRLTNVSPAGIEPAIGQNKPPYYWIINNFGTTSGLDGMTLRFHIPGGFLESSDPNAYKLYKRASNGVGAWTEFPASAVNLTENWVEFDNITSFSQAVISGSGVGLPIRLLSFEGKRIDDRKVELKWVTALEEDNKGFEVEKSIDGFNFSMIGFKDGAGNSIGIRNYNFIDVDAEYEAYYRLKQVDFDGKFTYSPIVYVEGSQKSEISLYPNPMNKEVKLNASENLQKAESIKMEVVDINGVVLFGKIDKLQNLEEILNKQVKTLNSGMYLIKFMVNNKAYTIKALKQ